MEGAYGNDEPCPLEGLHGQTHKSRSAQTNDKLAGPVGGIDAGRFQSSARLDTGGGGSVAKSYLRPCGSGNGHQRIFRMNQLRGPIGGVHRRVPERVTRTTYEEREGKSTEEQRE